jgi:ABC-2 type transport system permease protein
MKPLIKLTWVEVKLFAREPLAVLFAFAFPFCLLFVLAGVFGNSLDPNSPDANNAWDGVPPTSYLLPAYVGLMISSIGLLTLPVRLTTYREQGILRRFRAAGVPLTAVVGSQILVGIGMSALGGAAITAVSRIFYGTPFPRSWPETIAAFFLSAVAFCAFGVLLASVLRTSRAAQGAGLLLFFVNEFLSGAGPPRGALTDVMNGIGKALPLTHVVLLLQGAWLSFGWDWPATCVLLAIIVGATAISAWLFRWD